MSYFIEAESLYCGSYTVPTNGSYSDAVFSKYSYTYTDKDGNGFDSNGRPIDIVKTGQYNLERLYCKYAEKGQEHNILLLHLKAPAAGATSLSFSLISAQNGANYDYVGNNGVTGFFKCALLAENNIGLLTSAVEKAAQPVKVTNTSAVSNGVCSCKVEGTLSNILLLPNKDYWLCIFPQRDSDAAGWNAGAAVYIDEGTVCSYEATGSAGLCHIKNGNELKNVVIWIKNGNKLDLVIPYIKSGGSLKICS